MLRRLLEHLHAIMIIIDHIDIVLRIHDQICRALELAVAITRFAPDVQKIPARIEFADPILLRSETYTLPCASVATPPGLAKKSCGPLHVPHFTRNLPSESNFWTRVLPRSAT